MSTRKHWFALGVCTLMCVAGVVRADATSGSSDLGVEIAALKARIAQLEGEQGQTWLNERRAEEVKTLVRDVLADADTRASLLAEGATAGHDGGHFWIGSADGSFLLRVSGLIQVRHTFNSRDGEHDNGVDVETSFDQGEAGFSIPRAKVQFDGHISSPKITYALRLAVDRDSNDVWADRIVVGYQLRDNLWLGGGEDKAPFLREETTDAAHQLAVDRSLVNELFSAGRVQGVWANWHANDMIHVALAITDGARSGERKTGDDSKDFYADDSDFAITSRVDIRLAGNWEQADDFTAWSGEPMAAFIGGAVHYEVRETGDSLTSASVSSSGHQTDTFTWTVDGSVECSGANLYVAVVGASYDHETSGVREPDPLGIVVQGGYQIIPDKLELFGRWEYIDLDSGISGVDDQVNILTFGGNWYLNRHQSKVTVDVVYALDSLWLLGEDYVDSSTLAGVGLLQDRDDDEDGQVALRSQFTLTF